MIEAMGGTSTVPEPDPIARDYLLLALRLDQHLPGLVDGYFGPADLKAQVDLEPLRAPRALQGDAVALRDRVTAEVADDARRAWLGDQLTALETHAAVLAGEDIPYVERVRRSFSHEPPRHPDAAFAAASAELDRLLPGGGPLVERLAAWDARFTIPPDALPPVVDWLVDRFRSAADRLFGIPAGEQLTITYVRNQPWSGYNWYLGGLRSRVDLNLDLPVRARELVRTVAHETFPGHHLEHAWKEAALVHGARRLECSVLLINTPECLVSEGLADLGVAFAVPPEDREAVLLELLERARLPLADDVAEARDAVALDLAVGDARRALSPAAGNAALLRHADGASRGEALAYLRELGLLSEAQAAKRLEFIEHPLWSTYVFVYDEGEALLRRWVDAAPGPERAARFGRLLRESLTPGAIAADLADRMS